MTAEASPTTTPPAERPRRLDDPRTRRRLYALLAAAFFVLAWATQAMKSARNHEALDFIVTDAEGYYVYLPSLAIDGNLDFTNRIRYHATVHPIDERDLPIVNGKARNRWPIGVALTISPGFLLAHGASAVLYRVTGARVFAPDGYSILYQAFCLVVVVAWVWVGLAVVDGLVVRHFARSGLDVGGAAVAAGVLCYAAGTNYAYYAFREPFMAHAISATWVILTIDVADRIIAAAAERRVVAWQWVLLVFAGTMAFDCRYTDAALFPVLLWVLFVMARAGLSGRVVRLVPLLALAAAPLVLQALTLHVLAPRNRGPVRPQEAAVAPAQSDVSRASPTPSTMPSASPRVAGLGYRRGESFHWSRPALWQTLFHNFHGLLFWSPVLLLAAYGYGWYLLRRGGWRDPLVVCLLLSWCVLWYLNSAWYAWWFGKSFGGRSFVDFAGVFAIGMVLGFRALGRHPSAWPRPALLAIAAAVCVHLVLLALFVLQKIPRERPLWGPYSSLSCVVPTWATPGARDV